MLSSHTALNRIACISPRGQTLETTTSDTVEVYSSIDNRITTHSTVN